MSHGVTARARIAYIRDPLALVVHTSRVLTVGCLRFIFDDIFLILFCGTLRLYHNDGLRTGQTFADDEASYRGRPFIALVPGLALCIYRRALAEVKRKIGFDVNAGG